MKIHENKVCPNCHKSDCCYAIKSKLLKCRWCGNVWADGEEETSDENGEAKPDCAPRTCSARPSKCPLCGESIMQTNLGNGQTDDYCEECGWPDENRRAYIPPGELKITYAKLQQVIKECCSQIESAPGEPPEGYDVENAELVKVADASWEQGMRQLGTALLNWAYDELQAPNVGAEARDL